MRSCTEAPYNSFYLVHHHHFNLCLLLLLEFFNLVWIPSLSVTVSHLWSTLNCTNLQERCCTNKLIGCFVFKGLCVWKVAHELTGAVLTYSELSVWLSSFVAVKRLKTTFSTKYDRHTHWYSTSAPTTTSLKLSDHFNNLSIFAMIWSRSPQRKVWGLNFSVGLETDFVSL